MLLELVRFKIPEGRLEHRTWELIEIYLTQINSEHRGDEYAPSQLARFIRNLTSYDDFKDQLLFEWTDTKLRIFLAYYMEKPFCVINWIDC